MEQLLFDDKEVELFRSKIGDIGVNNMRQLLKMSKSTYYKFLKEPFREFRGFGRRKLIAELLYGGCEQSRLTVDEFGCSTVDTIPVEVILIDMISEELNKLSQDKLKQILKIVIALQQ